MAHPLFRLTPALRPRLALLFSLAPQPRTRPIHSASRNALDCNAGSDPTAPGCAAENPPNNQPTLKPTAAKKAAIQDSRMSETGTVGRVCVVGGIFMDLVIKTQRRPNAGETLVGDSFGMFIGGKGCNQAIAAQRMGAQTTMIGRVGEDTFGSYILEKLASFGLNTACIVKDKETGTGIGNPIIDGSGQNSIIVVPQASSKVSWQDIEVELTRKTIAECDVVVGQFETPVDATVRAAEIAIAHGKKFVLNAAPIPEVLGEMHRRAVSQASVLVVNEVEVTQLLGQYQPADAGALPSGGAVTVGQAVSMGMQLRDLTKVPVVVVTLGALGLVALDNTGVTQLAAHPVPVTDTTAAGDAFVGALAAALAANRPWPEALDLGNGAGALAVTVVGAEPSLPSIAAVTAFLTRGYVVSDHVPVAMQ